MESPASAERTFVTIPTRRSLLSRLKNWNDNESWKVFFDTYWKLIYNTAKRAGLSDTEAQDVVQETVISVLKEMPTFEYDPQKGSFKHWLFRITGRRIKDHMRKQVREQRIIDRRHPWDVVTQEGEPQQPVREPGESGFDKIWNDEWESNLQEAALERVKGKVDLKHYQIFDLYVMKNWSVADVARTLKVTQGRVYLTKHRISKLLRKEIEHLLANPIK